MKKRLTTNDLVTFFYVTTHCETKIMADEKTLKSFNEITCPECDEPLMFRGTNGLWYKVEGRIFP